MQIAAVDPDEDLRQPAVADAGRSYSRHLRPEAAGLPAQLAVAADEIEVEIVVAQGHGLLAVAVEVLASPTVAEWA